MGVMSVLLGLGLLELWLLLVCVSVVEYRADKTRLAGPVCVADGWLLKLASRWSCCFCRSSCFAKFRDVEGCLAWVDGLLHIKAAVRRDHEGLWRDWRRKALSSHLHMWLQRELAPPFFV